MEKKEEIKLLISLIAILSVITLIWFLPNLNKNLLLSPDVEGYGYGEECESNQIGFVETTRIYMADESYKNIEELQIDNEVMGYNFAEDENTPTQITEITSCYADELIKIKFSEGNDITTTPNIYFYTNNGWKKSGGYPRLKIGDEIDTGTSIKEVTEIIEITETTEIYTLKVEEDNYLIDDPILVGETYCDDSCEGKDCGTNDCGRSCGECENDESCIENVCVPDCVPNCLYSECGDDGCGGSCGICEENQICENGKCNEKPKEEKPKEKTIKTESTEPKNNETNQTLSPEPKKETTKKQMLIALAITLITILFLIILYLIYRLIKPNKKRKSSKKSKKKFTKTKLPKFHLKKNHKKTKTLKKLKAFFTNGKKHK